MEREQGRRVPVVVGVVASDGASAAFASTSAPHTYVCSCSMLSGIYVGFVALGRGRLQVGVFPVGVQFWALQLEMVHELDKPCANLRQILRIGVAVLQDSKNIYLSRREIRQLYTSKQGFLTFLGLMGLRGEDLEGALSRWWRGAVWMYVLVGGLTV